jgi:methylated-DNA-[protein]-cysteine S-methyltransferase
MTLYTHLDTPLGDMLATADDGLLTGLYFLDQAHAPRVDRAWMRDDEAEIFGWLREALERYRRGEAKDFDLTRVGLRGTPFQMRVWEEIRRIPFGETRSYGELARRIGSPEAVRAVGAAAGRNPVCWLVPCHRVIGRNGALTGYAGGLARKRAFLDFEAGRMPLLEVAASRELAAA